MPWLTDEAVNFRVAQIARSAKQTSGLRTFDFILWYREWTKNKTVNSKKLQWLLPAEKILLPRIVGGNTPERGNHFILWVFDFKKELRVYDSLGKYKDIDHFEMELLSDVFKDKGGLGAWTVNYPQQWMQTDGDNCGIFVCTAAAACPRNRDGSTVPHSEQ
ncbi:unnamed protein product [Gadus morhua 'NCC']